MENKMDISIAMFLALPESEGFDIYDKFTILIKSVDGDDYYLMDHLPEAGILHNDFGEEVYGAICKDVEHKDVFNWYSEWKKLSDLNNG